MKFNTKTLFGALAIVALVAGSDGAFAQAGTGTAGHAEVQASYDLSTSKQLVQNMTNEVIAYLDNRTTTRTQTELFNATNTVLTKYVDFQVMTSRALGPKWRTMADNERQKMTDLFKKLVIKTYANGINQAQNPKIVGIKDIVKSDSADVKMLVRNGDGSAKNDIDFKFTLEPTSGGVKIVDVSVLGISMVQTYRTQFSSLASQGNGDLVSALEKIVNK